MVEDMYQQESKEDAEIELEQDQQHHHDDEDEEDQDHDHEDEREENTDNIQYPVLSQTPKPQTSTGKRTEINATESDHSRHVPINTQLRFSENQATQATMVAPPLYPTGRDPDTCPVIGMMDYGTTTNAAAPDTTGSTLIRFGTTSGDVSLTLGLRHAGNMPEKNPFSVRDFGGF